RNDAHAAHSNNRQRNRIVARKDQKILRHDSAKLRDLRDVAAGFLYASNVRDLRQPGQCGWFDVRAAAAWNVVENDRLVDGFGDRAEMAILTFLRRLVVIGRCRKDRVYA